MSRTRQFVTALLMICAAGGGLRAARLSQPVPVTSGHPGASPIPATTNVYDADPAVAPALQIQSDKVGPYGTYNSATGDASIISTATGQGQTNAGGDWDVAPSGTRSIVLDLDFSQPIANTGPGASLPQGLYLYTSLISDCDLAGTNLLNMQPGSTASSPLNVIFEYSGGLYRLHMNPVQYPNTNYMTVTCTNAGVSHLCSAWTFGPSAGVPGNMANETALSQLITKGKNQTEVPLGHYYVSFFFSVTSGA